MMKVNKMAATMMNMELVFADKLTPGSLMPDDLIKIDDELIEVIDINSDATGDNYFIDCVDVYGEPNTITIAYDTYVDLYVYIDPEE
jgi:hypothetical protein